MGPFVPGQSNWCWCYKCSGLFFAGNVAPGACPAGGQHDGSQSGDYTLAFTNPLVPVAVWQWCNKCQGLGFVLGGTPGVCPAGGLHNHDGSGSYELYTSSGPSRQDKWRWCNKCQGLYYAGLGACLGGPVHVFSNSDDYAPALNLPGATGQAGWRFCSKCYGIAFSDGSRPPGACARRIGMLASSSQQLCNCSRACLRISLAEAASYTMSHGASSCSMKYKRCRLRCSSQSSTFSTIKGCVAVEIPANAANAVNAKEATFP